MQALDEKTKGFTLLEILVVVVIIGLISAIAFPNFSDWKKDREIRTVAEKVANMFANINTQTQRGSYPYVQIYINASKTLLTFKSKGMSQSTMSKKLNAALPLNCTMSNSSYWDNHTIKEIQSENVAINFVDGNGAVCFSKDGSYYKTMGKIVSGDVAIILCSRSNHSSTGVCPTTKGAGLIPPAYKIVWSRFANIEKQRWSGNVWTRQ